MRLRKLLSAIASLTDGYHSIEESAEINTLPLLM